MIRLLGLALWRGARVGVVYAAAFAVAWYVCAAGAACVFLWLERGTP